MTEQAVVGVGNQIMRDDGLSAEVIDRLREQGVADLPDVELSHAGTTAFMALEAMDSVDRAIVVDALQVSGSDAGDTHRMVYREGAFENEDPGIHMHDFSFTEALDAGNPAYDLPDEIVVLGMTPRDLSAGLALSEPIAENIDDLVALVREELVQGGTDLGDAPEVTSA